MKKTIVKALRKFYALELEETSIKQQKATQLELS